MGDGKREKERVNEVRKHHRQVIEFRETERQMDRNRGLLSCMALHGYKFNSKILHHWTTFVDHAFKSIHRSCFDQLPKRIAT